VREYFQLSGSPSAWPVIRAALATVSRLAVIPIQDLMDLPGMTALNQPGTAEGNWQWRYSEEQLKRLAAEKLETLRYWIRLYDRTGERMLRDYSEAPPAPEGAP
jgi:4-alpha-glucanotransferase